MATGTISGFWVLDIDPKGGGLDSMKALVAEHGALPATFTVKTGSGGYHYYFNLPNFTVKNDQSGHVAPGVDLRGEGGQVVAAPSASDKGDYVVIKDAPVADAPAWLLAKVRKDEKVLPTVTAEDLPKPEDIEPAEWARLNKYAQKAVKANTDRLDKMKADATPNPADYRGEPWNHTTFEVACALTELANSPWNAYSHGHVRRDLLAHAPRDREFDDHIVLKCLESATGRIGDKARAVPENRSAEPDPMLFGADVVDRTSNPTGGAGAEANHGVGGWPGRFFGEKNDLDVELLGNEVRGLGPLGWGLDEAWWSYEGGVWHQDPRVVRKRCSWLLAGKLRKAHAEQVSERLMFLPDMPIIKGDPVAQYLNFRNTMVDWQTEEAVEHAPEFLSTVQFPIDWNPEATCPTFDAFLADVMHDDYVALAWEMIGYLMYSGNPLQVAFLLYGGGGNGKGTLVRVIEQMLGSANIGNEPLDRLNNDRFSSVNLFSKIANIAGDIDATYQESTANFKRLTGEDTLAAERKFGDRFVFENWAVPLFSANKIPGSSDVSEGYLRRWVVLHFHKRIQNPNPGLSDILAHEVEGIAVKAVKALQVLMERRKFDPQGKAIEAKNEFAEAVDQVRQWVASDDVVSAPGHTESTRTLYTAYKFWAEVTHRGRMNEAEFAHRLESVGFERNGQIFTGIRPLVPGGVRSKTDTDIFTD